MELAYTTYKLINSRQEKIRYDVDLKNVCFVLYMYMRVVHVGCRIYPVQNHSLQTLRSLCVLCAPVDEECPIMVSHGFLISWWVCVPDCKCERLLVTHGLHLLFRAVLSLVYAIR